MHVFVFTLEAFFFAGLSMKTLMSELFEELLDLEYIHAVRYSGFGLIIMGQLGNTRPLEPQRGSIGGIS